MNSNYDVLQKGWKNIVYSVFDEVSGSGRDWIVTNNLKEIAFEGKVIAIAPASYFGDGKAYMSKIVVNPTWRRLGKLADASIPVTNDRHHIFFEGAHVKEVLEDGTQVVELVFGS